MLEMITDSRNLWDRLPALLTPVSRQLSRLMRDEAGSAVCKKTNITGASFHSLRHATATLLLSDGCDAKTLQAHLAAPDWDRRVAWFAREWKLVPHRRHWKALRTALKFRPALDQMGPPIGEVAREPRAEGLPKPKL